MRAGLCVWLTAWPEHQGVNARLTHLRVSVIIYQVGPLHNTPSAASLSRFGLGHVLTYVTETEFRKQRSRSPSCNSLSIGIGHPRSGDRCIGVHIMPRPLAGRRDRGLCSATRQGVARSKGIDRGSDTLSGSHQKGGSPVTRGRRHFVPRHTGYEKGTPPGCFARHSHLGCRA